MDPHQQEKMHLQHPPQYAPQGPVQTPPAQSYSPYSPYGQQPHEQAPMSVSHQQLGPQQHPQQHVEQHPPQHAHSAQLHPSAYGQKGGDWQAGLCSCGPCTSCLLGTFLPCILVGQTAERIRDPSMQSADMLNSDCLIHGAITCFTGCGWIYAMLKRGEIRERYDIKGSGCNDCCVSYWCPCCAVIQQDNEVKLRQKNGQPTTQQYQAQPGMQMPPQAYQPRP